MFRKQELIRFQHCDPAGIVFYPRYVEMINSTIEDWFAEAVGFDFATIHVEMQAAIPVVSLQIEFSAPGRLGERLQLDLRVERLGTSSIHLAVSASIAGEPKFEARVSLVHISKEDYRSRPWPERMREALAAQAMAAASASEGDGRPRGSRAPGRATRLTMERHAGPATVRAAGPPARSGDLHDDGSPVRCRGWRPAARCPG